MSEVDVERDLFAGVDWSTVDCSTLHATTSAELASLERANIDILMTASARAAATLTSHIQRAGGELSQLAGVLGDYREKLKQMGLEIAHIEQLNRGLRMQTVNQQKLLAVLDGILGKLSLDEDIAKLVLGPATNFDDHAGIREAADQLQAAQKAQFEDGLHGIRAVTERLAYFAKVRDQLAGKLAIFFAGSIKRLRLEGLEKQVKLKGQLRMGGADGLLGLTQRYSDLLLVLRQIDNARFGETINMWKDAMQGVLLTEFEQVVRLLQEEHLAKRQDKSFIFSATPASHRPLLPSLGKPAGPSSRDFSQVKLGQAIADFGTGDSFLPDQLLQIELLLLFPEVNACEQVLEGLVEDERRRERVVAGIFQGFDECIRRFLETCTRTDASTSPEILAVIDQRSADCTGHATFLRLLDILRPALVSTVESFYNDQIATMLDTRYSCKKRVGVFPTVATLPSFVQHYEQVAKLAADDSATKQLVGLVEERLAAALFRNLAGLAAEGDAVGASIGDDEDKGRLNAAVMIIENLHHLMREVQQRCSQAPAFVQAVLSEGRQMYDANMAVYARLSSIRITGKHHEFVEALLMQLRSIPPGELPYNVYFAKAAAKKALSSLTAKELRKNVDGLYKRLLKHFETPAVVSAVWSAIETEQVERWNAMERALREVYGASAIAELGLQWTAMDLQTCFRDY